MARYTLRICRDCGEMHQTNEWPRECHGQFRRARSDLPMPAIRSDGMDALLNHADGQIYDSRSAYERAVKDAGCEIIGNDFIEPKAPEMVGGLEQDIKDSIEQLEARL